MQTFQAPLIFSRRSSRVVSVGNLPVGGSAPICIQSMLTANTWDIPQVMEEIRALAEADCRLIRLTVPNQRSLESLPRIREAMQAAGMAIPLVADIHFNPQLAIDSCEFVEKVRINPGNYADRKRFEIREYSDAQYEEELARIESRLLPLIKNLKKYRCALRIGTNHGSLSDRILNRFGDTPEGMVESALEFVRIFQKHHYHEIILSMKSSNPLVMVQAYRSLTLQMEQEGMDYPLHLGVTEAGNGMEGRIKSAIGIGSLLHDGLGDTIRVSLTEPAENEIPAARGILAGLSSFQKETKSWPQTCFETPIQFSQRPIEPVTLLPSVGQQGALEHVQVGGEAPFRFLAVGQYVVAHLPSPFDKILTLPPADEPASKDIQRWNGEPASSLEEIPAVLLMDESDMESASFGQTLQALKAQSFPRLLLVQGRHPLFPVRFLRQMMDSWEMNWPVGVLVPQVDLEQGYGLAGEIGSLIADGLLQCLVCPTTDLQSPVYSFCETLLQGTRARMFKADFISCPSCGRTFFDLNRTTAAIKAQTQHLTGVKIGIMGCIVNGPGEMADADFGYVGAGEGKINLYRKQECVERNIPESQAVERLIDLIKAHGAWCEP